VQPVEVLLESVYWQFQGQFMQSVNETTVTYLVQEATSAVMELHDDDPDHFEFAMKFVYTEPYDVQAIQKMAGNDKLKRVLIPIGVHAVADKYDIVRLYEPAAQDFVSVFRNTPDKDNTLVVAVVQTCYSTIHRTNSAIGKMIAATTRRKYGAFIQSPAFDLLVQAFPVFAADIVLSCKQDGPHVFNARTEKCEHCDEMNMVSMIGKNDKRALKGKCWNCERVLTMPARS
jgi:hypothetical protein